ncbi:DNA excision repair protein ERCC-5 [Plasmodium inui San Antonio 1]|uniref:DNA excision repair protein ERCC-5 n=1 Tax=Plasmodium inui San Antonio 1 TaxID=1237626 RepID=W7A0X8_9APIC|nr:DNA excision repair protein ERCC-5 [Plasmodium inui San Antonio 1]EUD66852.1 DNA excision repair protein ERCC-5 [Plasmodium inui San Antonio 1]
MGVKGLWSIVAPVGVRVNPEIFTGKRIAIDVSIWLYELTYANNLKVLRNGGVDNMSIFNDLWMDFSENMSSDIRPDNLKKVHLYFFFLRICKLLYYNIRPIFIFDGTPPELKRKTIFQRNIRRRNHEERFKKTAEKLIYNYYQRTLLKSLKSRSTSRKKSSNGKEAISQGRSSTSVGLDTRVESNPSASASASPFPAASAQHTYELIEIYDSIRENDASLASMVEHIGNVPISIKDVLNICNDEDLKKIQNKVLMITDLEVLAGGMSGKMKGKEIPSGLEEIPNDRKENGERDSGVDSAAEEGRTKDEDEYATIMRGESPPVSEHLNDMENQIDEEIVRKKHLARKKYYESIPKNFKGFLCMRRPVDIIDISNYSTDILEFTRKLGEGEGQEVGADEVGQAVGMDEAVEQGRPAKDPTEGYILHRGEPERSLMAPNTKQRSVEKRGGPDNAYVLLSEGDTPEKEEPDEENLNRETPQKENPPHKEQINILELPPTFDRADLFHEGKDEYKVYYVNNEEIKIPLFKELNKDVFEKLPIKLQYQILQDIKEEWYVDNRVKAIKAKDDMDIFSQVQLETYVRMIKTDFEIEKLKIKMAEKIQKADGELVINKEMSKQLDSISIRDYNDVVRKKKKKKKKKYFNEILNECYFEGEDEQYKELYVKGEEDDDEEAGMVMNAQVVGERLAKGEDDGSVRHDQRISIEAYGQVERARRRDVTRPKREQHGEDNQPENGPENGPEDEKKALIKMEKEFKQDLLLDDEELFGEDLLRVVDEDGQQIEENPVEEKQTEEEQVEGHPLQGSTPPKGETPPGANKADAGEQITLLRQVDIYENRYSPPNLHSSGDDFENCSVDEKEQREEDLERPIEENEGLQIVQDVIDLTSNDEQAEGEVDERGADRDTFAVVSPRQGLKGVMTPLERNATPAGDPSEGHKQREISIGMSDGEEICQPSNEPHISAEKEVRDEVMQILQAAPRGGERAHVEAPPLHDKVDSLIVDSSNGEESSEGEDKQKISEEIKKVQKRVKQKVKRFMSKDEINNLLLNKVDLGNVGKESYLENLLSNKVLLDRFGVGGEAGEAEEAGAEEVGDESSYEVRDEVRDEAHYKPRHEDILATELLDGEGSPPDDRDHMRDSRALDAYLDQTNKENEHLVREYKKLKKNNIEINEEMNEDIKILLNMFGIPYVQSPCEAEAQCSYLNCNNHCDAIISDDSDVLVFSGKTVIKNFFNRKKTVEVYERKLIEDKLGLYQDELINLSLLCGCDYTIGVHGVGIVNALEIIKAFPTFDDLKKLKEIVSNPFRDLSKDDKYFNNEEVKRFLKTHKNYKLNWIFPRNFPDREVYKCFKYPKVCTDIEKFQWHVPNLSHISRFLHKATNIPEEKIHNVLSPILQKYDVNVRSYQLKIDDFFPIIQRKRKSVDDLIHIIRDTQKGKRRDTSSGKRGKGGKTRNATIGGSSPLGRDITSLIDLNPAGVIRSKRMSAAMDGIKGRARKRGSSGGAPK